MAQSATEEQETEGLALEGRGEGEEVPVLKMTAKQWVAGLTAIAAIAQAIYGLLALVFTLTQSTQIVSWYYTTTYTGIMGGLWVMLFLTAAIRWRHGTSYSLPGMGSISGLEEAEPPLGVLSLWALTLWALTLGMLTLGVPTFGVLILCVLTFVVLTSAEAKKHKPKVVYVDSKNRIVKK